MSHPPEIRIAVYRLTSTLVFAGGIATIVSVLGTRDLEGYDLSFFSLNRGTAVQTVQVLRHPVHTLAIGLGARLPLHGSLGASPAAALAPHLPAPLTYWLLLVLSIGAAAMLVRHALEPLVGSVLSWLALVLLFCSAPMVSYTVYDDWPENAVTYPAFVACAFAPHAWLALIASRTSPTIRRLAGLAVAGALWALIAVAHPGHWPLLAASLALAWTLALLRSDHPLRARLTAVAGLAAASLVPVVLQAPDILRELYVAGTNEGSGMQRLVEGATDNLLSANAYPFGQVGSRLPFTYLVLAMVSLVIGLTSKEAHLRRLIVGGALMSLALGLGASTLPAGTAPYSPSIAWGLRDPATAFAVLGASCAAAAARGWRGANRLLRTGSALTALLLAGLQGPAYAAGLISREPGGRSLRWNQDMTAPETRVSMRGLLPGKVPPEGRLAFWPGVRDEMRNRRQPTADFVDAGYLLVTAWTKDRTMRGLVEPNDLLFNQVVELSPAVLCSAPAVRFLQLRYLLLPRNVDCAPWSRVPGLLVDGWLDVGVARDRDDRIRALPVVSVDDRISRAPALSPGSRLLNLLMPLSGTSISITSRGVDVRLDTPSLADGRAIVLPVAYDPAWRPSSGRPQNIGGLLALVGVDQHQITVEFVPDAVARLRAVSMTLAQILAVVALIALAGIGWVPAGDALGPSAGWAREAVSRVVSPLRPVLRRRDWLYFAYTAAFGLRLGWRPEGADDSGLLAGVLLPVVALSVARLAQREWVHRWVGAALWAVAVVEVGAGGSRAAEALHDPLFWGLAAVAALGVSVAAGRRQLTARAAAALAGACTMVATLLPVFPGFESRFPDVNLATIHQSFSTISDRLGVVATMLLAGCWVQAIAVGGGGRSRGGRTGAAARGALLAGLILVFAGAVPEAGIETSWMIALGVLLGLAEARAR
ncbi:MAG: hypothetical protein HY655_14055 [Acidobacteria bacterium]|nr:hypothetical protein [Acidobacteriota bacterium]